MSILITEDNRMEKGNPTPVYDIAPSPKLYQTYLRAWYRQEGTMSTKRENNPTSDYDLPDAATAKDYEQKAEQEDEEVTTTSATSTMPLLDTNVRRPSPTHQHQLASKVA
jgi:hypothetical protein